MAHFAKESRICSIHGLLIFSFNAGKAISDKEAASYLALLLNSDLDIIWNLDDSRCLFVK